jgi:1,4-dihydroxy-6-naphthoate synthase
MTLSFAFSPCPNDTFMFEPIAHKKIDLLGLDFDIMMEDVEQLNKAALNNRSDITKLSYNAFTSLYKNYQLLHSGSALGNHCGPLLISKKPYTAQDVDHLTIAVPGFHTTAYLLLKYAFPKAINVREALFSDIEQMVLDNKVDAGVIIHENRFTYQSKGLLKIIDLGERWENTTSCPIPLGGIVIKRSLPEEIKQKVNQIITASVRYAFEHPDEGIEFIASHAQEMDRQVMMDHIRLYVNEYSKDLGIQGRNAVEKLFRFVHPGFKHEDMPPLFV